MGNRRWLDQKSCKFTKVVRFKPQKAKANEYDFVSVRDNGN